MRYADFAPAHAGVAGFWPARRGPTKTQKVVSVGIVGGIVAGAIVLYLTKRRTSPGRLPPIYSAPPPISHDLAMAGRGEYR